MRDHGGRVLALTDGPASPLAPLADIALYARTERQFAATSDTATAALIEALCGAVAHRSKHSLESAANLTAFVLPWLHAGQAPRATPAANTEIADTAGAAAATTRRGRKRASAD